MKVVVVTVATLVATNAWGDGTIVVGGSPRAIGRAGTATVGDDGGGALLVNPAAMARRETTRAQVGVAIVDDAVTFQSATFGASPSATQGNPAIAPLVAIEGSIAGFVVGAGAMTASAQQRSLRPPSELPADQLGARFDYRYAGIAGELRRDSLVAGLARRLGDQVAIGASIAASRVTVGETRRIWAGFDGRDALGDPASDLEIEARAHDNFVPSGVLGVFVAPSDTPLELGGSVAYGGDVRADGSATIVSGGGPTATPANPSASIALAQPITVRGGARYVGERVVVEVGVDWWKYRGDTSARWAIDGITVHDPSGVATNLPAIPSRIAPRTHAAYRGAADVNIVEGLLWLTAGYAYTRGGTQLAQLSPSFGDLGGHTFALGLEGTAGGFTLSLGWSRTISTPHTDAAPDLALDNPFAAGDGAVFAGTYRGSIDQIGLLVEMEMEK